MSHKLYSEQFKNISTKEISKKIQSDCQKFTTILRKEIEQKKIASIDAIFGLDDLKIFQKLSKKISSYKKIVCA